jgi:hypothetical protein
MDRLFNLLGSIVTVALVTTVVVHPDSAKVVQSFGDFFAGSLRTAMGR